MILVKTKIKGKYVGYVILRGKLWMSINQITIRYKYKSDLDKI